MGVIVFAAAMFLIVLPFTLLFEALGWIRRDE